jgi:hypothetical protein
MVQVTVVEPSMPVSVSVVSQLFSVEVSWVPVVLSQEIVALVSPEPPSRKLTWMSESGGLWNVAVALAAGRLSVQLVPFATVTDWSASDASASP